MNDPINDPGNDATARPPAAEVIAIGDEMTGGARIDTNSAWIADRLEQLGLQVRFHSMVGDDLDDCVDVFRIAGRRSDVVVMTGGLGPTRDDLTRQAMAAMAGVPLVQDDESLRHIESLFSARGRSMPERNRTQAMFPAGSQIIFNPQGTAPGVDLTLSGSPACRFFALPGVPAEMKQMFESHVASRLRPQSDGPASDPVLIRGRVLKFFGIGESDMEALLGDRIARGRDPRVGITVSSATISLRMTTTGRTETECTEKLDRCGEDLIRCAEEYYFGEGETYELHHAVHDAWSAERISFGVLEIGPGAVLAPWFASIENSVSYRGGVHRRTLQDVSDGAVDKTIETVCEEACQHLGSDRLILVDRYPSLTTADDTPMPAAEVRLGVYQDGKLRSTRVTLGGHPSILHARIGKAALAWARQCV